MATKLQRYEAAVKLSTGEVVTYHNINTGLFKFHRFINEKFSNGQVWVYYKVRRIENKEEIGMFVNEVEDKEIKAICIMAENSPNATGTGYILSIPFIREGYTINRNVFVANSQVLDRNNDFILISEWLFKKMIKEAKNALYEFYLEKQHNVVPNDFELGEIEMEETSFIKKGKQGIYPTQNYP